MDLCLTWLVWLILGFIRSSPLCWLFYYCLWVLMASLWILLDLFTCFAKFVVVMFADYWFYFGCLVVMFGLGCL